MPKGQNKKLIRGKTNELGRKIITKFVGLREQTYSYLRDHGSKKSKGHKQYVIKRTLTLENDKQLFRGNSTWE